MCAYCYAIFPRTDAEEIMEKSKTSPHGEVCCASLLSCYRSDADVGLVVTLARKGYDTIYECEESVVATHAHVLAGVVNRTTLTYDDVTCLCKLATPDLHTEAFAF